MKVIQNEYPYCDRLDKIYKNKIYSYAHHIENNPEYLDTASIVYFGRNLKQNNLIHLPWVREHWI